MHPQVHILGISTAFPNHLTTAEDVDEFARKWCQDHKALQKSLHVNKRSQILTRPTVIDMNAFPLVNEPRPPTIDVINGLFMDKGVELAVRAAKGAIEDWGGELKDITHLVCTATGSSSFPGFDHAVMSALGLPASTDRTLLHGVGCAGGLAVMRLARQLALANAAIKPPRVLVIAAEVNSTLYRASIDIMHRAGDKAEVCVGMSLFSDGASAMIIGGGELNDEEHSSFEILEAVTETVPDSVKDLEIKVFEYGWTPTLTPRVPSITGQAVLPVFQRLLSSSRLQPATPSQTSGNILWRAGTSVSNGVLSMFGVPRGTQPTVQPFLSNPPSSTSTLDLDWLVHPGGSAILTKVESSLGINSTDHTKSSWHIYRNKGNTGSVSIGAVIERSREEGEREGCVAVAFGPGVTCEMALLRRTGWKGRMGKRRGGTEEA